MRSQVEDWYLACVTCARLHVGRAVQPPLTPIPIAGRYDRVGVGILKFPKSVSGNLYAMMFVDCGQRYLQQQISQHWLLNLFVWEVVCRHGVPAELLSKHYVSTDAGRSFGCEETEHYWLSPQTDGLVERFNCTPTNMLAKRVQQNSSHWDHQPPLVLFAYRASIQESTWECLFFLEHRWDPKLPFTLDVQSLVQNTEFPWIPTKEDLYQNWIKPGI